MCRQVGFQGVPAGRAVGCIETDDTVGWRHLCPASLPDFSERRLGAIAVATVVNDDRKAVAGQPRGDRGAYALAGAGNENGSDHESACDARSARSAAASNG